MNLDEAWERPTRNRVLIQRHSAHSYPTYKAAIEMVAASKQCVYTRPIPELIMLCATRPRQGYNGLVWTVDIVLDSPRE